jgi:hypothetical protein
MLFLQQILQFELVGATRRTGIKFADTPHDNPPAVTWVYDDKQDALIVCWNEPASLLYEGTRVEDVQIVLAPGKTVWLLT